MNVRLLLKLRKNRRQHGLEISRRGQPQILCRGYGSQ